MALSVHIPALLAQRALNANTSHSFSVFFGTRYTVMLLINLDVSNHN